MPNIGITTVVDKLLGRGGCMVRAINAMGHGNVIPQHSTIIIDEEIP